MVERDGVVIGMVHGYRITESEPEDNEDSDPILELYANLEAPGSFYTDRAREVGLYELSLIAFEQNEGAVELYERSDFKVVARTAVVPHEFIRYTGDAI